LKPFDANLAAAGEQVQANYEGEWIDVHYVGLSRYGTPVFDSGSFSQSPSIWSNLATLRMAPKVRTVYVAVYMIGGGVGSEVGQSDAAIRQVVAGFNGRIVQVIPVEIEE
jgi:hypothetical protein